MSLRTAAYRKTFMACWLRSGLGYPLLLLALARKGQRFAAGYPLLSLTRAELLLFVNHFLSHPIVPNKFSCCRLTVIQIEHVV